MDLVAVEQRDGSGDSLSAHQSSVEAFQIADEELAVSLLDLGMTARDDCRRRVNHYFTFRIAAQAGDFLIQFDTFGLLRLRID
jgi:hypothetical protein